MTFGPASLVVSASRSVSRILRDVVGAVDLPHPVDADALHRLGDRLLVERDGLSAREDRMSWPPVADE